jgi:hypothetical protein
VTFLVGSTEARTSAFEIDVHRLVVVTVGCHQSFVPPQLVKVDVLPVLGQRVVSRRCRGGASPPACIDIGLDVELDPGTYVVQLQREDQYRTWPGYSCTVSVEGP